MDNEIEELGDLGLKLMFLWCSSRTHRAAESRDAARLRKRGVFLGPSLSNLTDNNNRVREASGKLLLPPL
jgi:hypothetical protein